MKWLLIVVELLGDRGPIYHAIYGSALFNTRAECEARVDSMRSTSKSEKFWTPELIFCFAISRMILRLPLLAAISPRL